MPDQQSARIEPGLAAYLAVGTFALLVVAAQASQRTWSTPDFWLLLGPVREFSSHPFNPAHPLIIGTVDDPYMSPYSWLLGMLARLSTVSPITILAVAGVVNLALILAGLWRLARRLSHASLAPALSLIFVLTAWGWAPWRWSGYLNLNSLGSVLPFGSAFATGVGLHLLASFDSWLDKARSWDLFAVSLAFPLVLLAHPLTGAWIALFGVTLAILQGKLFIRRRLLLAVAAATVSCTLILIWPFYSVVDLLHSSESFDGFNAGVFRKLLPRTFLALPGVVILVARLRRNSLDRLGIVAVTIGLAFAVAAITDRAALGRVLPGFLLALHLAMGDWFATRIQHVARCRSMVRATAVLIVVVGLSGTATGWIRAIPNSLLPDRFQGDARLSSQVDPYLGLGDIIPAGSNVAADDSVSLVVGAVSGKVIDVVTPLPFSVDHDQRAKDQRSILDPKTSAATRDRLVSQYSVEWFVVPNADAQRLANAAVGSEVVGSVSSLSILRVHPGSP